MCDDIAGWATPPVLIALPRAVAPIRAPEHTLRITPPAVFAGIGAATF